MEMIFSRLFSPAVDFDIDEAWTADLDSGGPSFALLPGRGAALTGIHSAVNKDSDVSYLIDEIDAAVTEPIVVMTDQRSDLNRDFKVDALDLSILSNNYNGANRSYNQGDIDLNGVVNALDLSILSIDIGQSVIECDFNGDRDVDGDDFSQIAANWGVSVTPGADGDANYDGFVDRDDAEIYGELWMRFSPRPAPLVQIPGDLDFDGGVDGRDQIILLNHYNQSVASGTNGDMDGNGVVNVLDLSLFSPCLGDLWADVTGDGRVGIDDVDELAINWHQSVTNGRLDGDVNEDGFVDAADLQILGLWMRATWFGTDHSSIPEPSALGLVGLSVAVLLSRARR
jgi:hypothetical protein